MIGLDPELIDFSSPDFAAFPGLTAAKVMEGLTAAEVGLRALGYDAHHCLTDFGETAELVVTAELQQRQYDCIMIGAGVRTVPSTFILFEKLIDFEIALAESRDWGLAKVLPMWHEIPMNATLSLDEAGRLVLPNSALRLLGMKPGDQVRADVSPNRIEICAEPPVMAEGVIENGILVMARQGIAMDAAAAVRADRNDLANRSLPR